MRVVAFENAFHGRALGALSMTGTPKYREGFGPLGPVTHVPYGDAEAVERAMGPDVCAIIVEPVQGEGGVVPAPAGFLAALRSIAWPTARSCSSTRCRPASERLRPLLGKRRQRREGRRDRARKGPQRRLPARRDAHDGGARGRAPSGHARNDVRRQRARLRRGPRRPAYPRQREAHRRRPHEGAKRSPRCSARWRVTSPTCARKRAARGFSKGSCCGPASSRGRSCRGFRTRACS